MPFVEGRDENQVVDVRIGVRQDGIFEHRYLWGPGTDQLLADEVFDSAGQVDETLWAATDHLGTVGQLLDVAGDVVEHREYDSFGALSAAFDEFGDPIGAGLSTGYQTLLHSDIGFAGRLQDRATGLSQNRDRWYDPNTGRFIGEDPAQDGTNWYRYAGNDPINFRDPSGLSQAGNPLNILFGGFSGNVVEAAKDAFFDVGQFFGNVSNTIGRVFNSGVSTLTSSLGTSRSTISTTTSNPIGNSVFNTGSGQNVSTRQLNPRIQIVPDLFSNSVIDDFANYDPSNPLPLKEARGLRESQTPLVQNHPFLSPIVQNQQFLNDVRNKSFIEVANTNYNPVILADPNLLSKSTLIDPPRDYPTISAAPQPQLSLQQKRTRAQIEEFQELTKKKILLRTLTGAEERKFDRLANRVFKIRDLKEFTNPVGNTQFGLFFSAAYTLTEQDYGGYSSPQELFSAINDVLDSSSAYINRAQRRRENSEQIDQQYLNPLNQRPVQSIPISELLQTVRNQRLLQNQNQSATRPPRRGK